MMTYNGPSLDTPRRGEQGFTLIELVVAMTIIAILARFAITSYLSSMQKSYRTDAKSALLDLASREERYFSIYNTYTNSGPALGLPAFPFAISSGGSSYYTMQAPTITAPSASVPAAFVATAVPTGNQTGDTTCYSFQINQLGVQTNVDSSSNPITANSGCW